MHTLITLIIMVSLSLFSTASALPNSSGATGLVTMPTADILKYKEYNIAFDYNFNLDDKTNSEYYYKFNVGALDNMELGFIGGTNPNEGVFLNLKWSLSANTGRFPLQMAVGLEKLTSQNQSDFYIVTSKKLRSDLGFHGGFKAIFDKQVQVGFMAGVDYSYSDSIFFLGDLSTSGDNIYSVNLSAFYKILFGESIDNIYLRGSIQNLLRSGPSNSYFNLGICYFNIL